MSDTAKAMREACAKEADQRANQPIHSDYDAAFRECALQMAYAIRALPIPAPQPDPREEALRLARDAMEEAAALFEEASNGNYTPDSFTGQPLRIAIAAIDGLGLPFDPRRSVEEIKAKLKCEKQRYAGEPLPADTDYNAGFAAALEWMLSAKEPTT
jgi:hypothetical protein